MDFQSYLEKKKRVSKQTAIGYVRLFNEFNSWVEKEQQSISELAYNDLLAYIRYCLDRSESKRYVNSRLTVVRHYYNYLIFKREVTDNIAQGLHLKGVSRRLPHNLLDEQTLIDIYEKYPIKNYIHKRNKVMIGMMIYQGITTAELAKIEPNNIMLREGKLYVPGSKKSNAREIPLAPCQIIEIKEYIDTIRPLFLATTGKETNKLFTSSGGGNKLANVFGKLTKSIMKYEPNFQSLAQIRTSVITIWLQKFNLRQTQYMAGHRYVSSTERYQLSNLDDLKKDLGNFHPL